jgi:hypothetical protein
MVQVAETSKPKKSPKVLDHLELHPQLGGGHIVKHVYTDYQHEPMPVKFNKAGIAKGGEHIQAHLDKHAGLPKMSEGQEADEGENED